MGWATLYKRRLKVFTTALLIYLDYKVLCAAGFVLVSHLLISVRNQWGFLLL